MSVERINQLIQNNFGASLKHESIIGHKNFLSFAVSSSFINNFSAIFKFFTFSLVSGNHAQISSNWFMYFLIEVLT